MIDSAVIIAIVVAITWLVSLRIWLNNSAHATAVWKGRYMTLKRQLEEGGGEEELKGVLEQLPQELRSVVEPILDSLPRQYRGIAKWLIKNPQIIQMGLQLLQKTQKSQIQTEAL